MSESGDMDPNVPPARGERHARWGYGYQDKAATELIFRAVKDERRSGGARLEGVRLADERAGRVDDCVLVWGSRIQGNSVKWRKNGTAMGWAELLGAEGLLRELSEGYAALKQTWTGRTVSVRLQTSYPASDSEAGRLVAGLSVADFVGKHWGRGPAAAANELVSVAWQRVESHTGLHGRELEEFASACELAPGIPEPCVVPADDEESRAYQRQFNRMHRALATWLTMHPKSEMVEMEYLLEAVALRSDRSELVQSFPPPSIPYRRNECAANELRHAVKVLEGGYVAVTGSAGGGKSTLVQDVLGADPSIVLAPYFAFLPDGEGPARERGEAMAFYRSVVGRLDRAFPGRGSLGIDNARHGREALRGHMASAHEQFMADGVKTVLLVDGLDHVQREPDLAQSILREFPEADEIPSGFLIVLSGRPEALLADAVGPVVSRAIAETGRRVTVEGLSREEVHEIALEAVSETTAAERDRVYRECAGNPLILTYRLNALRATDGAGAAAVEFDGDIDGFYSRSFAVPLRNAETRRLLGLLCRAAPAIDSRWLEQWPEWAAVEELYESVLAPFMTEEHGELRFIHSSLITFLMEETRPRLPGADRAAREKAYFSDLADRTEGRPCRDALGRAHVFHLSRAGRSSEVLAVATSRWFREAVYAFVPYALVRPVILEALRVAWEQAEYREVVRVVLLDAELAQRSAHLGAGELAEALLKLGDHELALAQIRANGMLLVDDDVALEFSRKLWLYGQARSSSGLQESSRRLYADAKPLGHLLGAARGRLEQGDYELRGVLEAWSAASPLFESVEDMVDRLVALEVEPSAGAGEDGGVVAWKAAQMLAALRTAVRAQRGTDAERQLLGAIGALEKPQWELAALLVLSRCGEASVSAQALVETWERCGDEWHLALELAEQLYAMGEEGGAKAIVGELEEAGVAGYERSEYGSGCVDVSFVVSLTELREVLGFADASEVQVENDGDEGVARVVAAARRLGALRAAARRGAVVSGLRDDFRGVLFYESRKFARPGYSRRPDDVVVMSRRVLMGELVATARSLGSSGMRALRDVVRDATSSGTFLGWYRRRLATAFRREGVLSTDEALALGLSWTADAEDEDPRARQEACLEIAAFVRGVGSDGWPEWAVHAGRASAGAGSHKDYRMAHLAGWLDESMGAGPPSVREVAVLGKFLRAVEVSGGDGGYEAAEQVLRTVLRVSPARAAPLAVEMIDRNAAGLQGVLEALVVGGSSTGASPELLAAVFEELLSLVALQGLGEAAGAVVDAYDDEGRVAVAQRLMRRARTNCLPSTRLDLARDIQQALGRHGWGDVDLGEGLPEAGGERDDYGSLYRLADGRCLTSAQVGARLASADTEADWDPNPKSNKGYNWRSALQFAGGLDADRLDAVLARGDALEDYREAEILAARSVALHARDDLAEARELAEGAVAASHEYGWFVRGDGGQRRAAYRALGALDAEDASRRSREHFGRDLADGALGDYFVISELTGLFEFLGIAWPTDAVLEAIDDFLDEVLAASKSVDEYESLSGSAERIGADQAIATFLVGLLGLPAVDVARAARRALSSYLARCPCGFVGALLESAWSDIELEHLLIAIDVTCCQSTNVLSATLRTVVQGLNVHESLAVRSVARRICGRAGWEWVEVRDRTPAPRVLVGTQVGRVSREDSEMLVDGAAAATWGLFEDRLSLLRGSGIAEDELENEYAVEYSRIESSHRWREAGLEQRWRQSSFAAMWLRPRAVIGRAAAMRVLGRYALEGRGPGGAEEAYDHLFPLYDPVLDWRVPVERPVELRALEWSLRDEREKSWAEGENADEWSQYPECIGSLRIIGEVSYFARPERENSRETRVRGVVDREAGERLRVEADEYEVLLSVGSDLTYEDYACGRAGDAHWIVARNGQRLLAGALYRWVALSAGLARELGWSPSKTDPFGWEDPDGARVVSSVYWRDGRTDVAPPRWDSLEEGWCLLATEEAVRAIAGAVDGAAVHLVVRRQRFGAESSDRRWHLECVL